MTRLLGFKVYVSRWCVTGKWLFPQRRFFEWEAKDEAFCRKYGIGREEPACYRIGNSFVMHPEIYEQLKESLPLPEKDRIPITDPRSLAMFAV